MCKIIAIANQKGGVGTKLENVEHQLETAKIEVEKPFAQEAELAEKLERLADHSVMQNDWEPVQPESISEKLENAAEVHR